MSSITNVPQNAPGISDLISLSKVKADFAVPFNHRVIEGQYLISNELGDHLFLQPAEFKSFVYGEPKPGEGLYDKLKGRNFIAAELDIAAQAQRWREKRRFLFYGPVLHAFVLTHRCNHGCQYCHSSIVGMDRTDTDMTVEVAEARSGFGLSDHQSRRDH
jgi:sulfatase maturation enzyme AslB (radical SAM superfamily)